MKTQNTTIQSLFNDVLRTFQISFKLQSLIVLLVFAFTASCSKEDPEPAKIEIEQIDPLDDPEKEEEEEETPPPITQSDIAIVDDAVSSFMSKYSIPGATIAVSVNEKMVYTKGFGHSNVENNTATKADDVFRVASLSKPFTATAIMKLVDQDKISLNDKVFGPDGILGSDFGTAILTADELAITVDHLLIHGGGGWSVATGGDPIDYEPQLEGNAFIEYVLNNWDLTNAPGTNYAFSNMGYWLLARIVEKVSGLPFEDFVRNMVAPTGISSFKTTNFTREDRETNEVEYYAPTQEIPWIYAIASRRDGDGGVVISAPDILRFLSAIDGKTIRQDIISTSSQNLMSQPSNLSSLGRGLGTWQEQNMLFFTGSLPGTRTWFYMNQENGISAVVLLNYRSDQASFDTDLNNLVFDLVKNSAIPWQSDFDQF